MISTMGQPTLSCRAQDEPDFNLREWALKACISRENTKSRRHSASNLRSFREETKSFRSNTTISSTASSPGYTLREVIDPSTYSFTTALRALQERSRYGWEWTSPDGFALNSKWNEAEKYICNPLSGEVPMECLSAKTQSGRSTIPTKTRRVTMSGPIVYSSHAQLIQTKDTIEEEDKVEPPIQEKKVDNLTRDVGTQSTPHDLSSSRSLSPASTPSIKEISIKKCEVKGGEPPKYGTKFNLQEEIERKESREEEEEERCKCKQRVCLPWKNLWMRKKQRGKQKLGWQVLFWGKNIKSKE